MRRLSGASTAVTTFHAGPRWRHFGLTGLCVLGLAAFIGGAASPAGAATDQCANAAYRVGASANLPDCRVYEQVSPVDKNGNAVKSSRAGTLPNPGWASSDGGTALYNPAYGPNLLDPARGFSFAQVSERTPSGWASRPAANGPSANGVVDGVSSVMINQLPSADRKGLLFVSGTPFTLDNPNLGTIDSAAANLARGTQVDWISKPSWEGANPAPGHLAPASFSIAGATADLSTAFFTSLATLTPEDGVSGRIGVYNYTDPNMSRGLYRWRNGQLSNAAVLPDGTLDPWGAVMAGWVPDNTGSNAIGNPTDLYGSSSPVSRDGSSWVFVSPDPVANSGQVPQLYLGRDGLPSVLLSTKAGQSTPVAGSAGVSRTGARTGATSTSFPGSAGTFAVRSKDGRFTVFTTADALTDTAPEDASQKTYRYDLEQGTLTYLPDLTFAGVPNLGPVLRISDNGSRIFYFNWETGALGLWRDDGPSLVLAVPTPGGGKWENKFDSRFSSDGRTLVLTSAVALREEPDHPADTVQIYRYTEANDELDCISCPSASVTPRDSAVFNPAGYAASTTSPGGLKAVEENRGISDDGKRVFFHTTSPLLGDDHNEVADVYAWSEGSGLELLSGGRAGALDSFILDSDAGGDNVFFVTAEGLVPQDVDGVYDLYDARVGGGFPRPPVIESCSGEACQGRASTPPAVTALQSITLRPSASGDRRSAKPLSLKGRNANARRVTLRVRTAGAGRLSAQGRTVRPAKRAVKRAATYTLRLNLRRGARRALHHRGRLKVRVRVRFNPVEGRTVTKTVKLTVKTNRKGN